MKKKKKKMRIRLMRDSYLFSLFIIGLYSTLYVYFFFLKEGPLKTSFAEG